MRWQGGRESENVEDDRGSSGSGFMGVPLAVHGGLGTLVVILIVSWLFGVNPVQLLQQMPQAGNPGAPVGMQPGAPNLAQNQLVKFVKVILADTEDVWNDQFNRMGRRYREPKLLLFNGSVQSACGFSSAAVGPFYCPEDEKVYFDLSFFEELQRRFHAPGDFAQAYVIAHEVGHHVQKLLGIMDKVDAQRRRLGRREANELSVRLELQADFLAGVWANHAQKMKQILEPGDLEEAIRAASAIGDDQLQKQAQGYVVPDAFTHGTSAQRVKWFRKGFETGDIRQGDTFNASDL
jgi:uncharacterized protein